VLQTGAQRVQHRTFAAHAERQRQVKLPSSPLSWPSQTDAASCVCRPSIGIGGAKLNSCSNLPVSKLAISRLNGGLTTFEGLCGDKYHRLNDFRGTCSRRRSELHAYSIQDSVAWNLGPVAGWKVGSETLDSEPFRAPIHESTLFVEQGRIAAAMFHIIGIEAEIAYSFARDLPPEDAPQTREAVLDAIASMHPAIEVVDTRFQNFGKVNPLVQRADQGNHGALVVGPGLQNWRALNPEVQPVHLEIDGACVCDTIGGNSAVDPVRLLVWLANGGAHSLGGLRAGQIVTTGSCSGTIFVKPGAHIHASFPGLGSINLTIA
jgi:2-keto-4-pentenoate hydratase